MIGYEPRKLKNGRTVSVWKDMSCTCRRCKTVLTTQWPDTWQTHGWWCVVGKKVKLYCKRCKRRVKKEAGSGEVSRQARKDKGRKVYAARRRGHKKRG